MLKTLWFLVKETFAGWYRDDGPQLAAALAFYAILSFTPTVSIVIAISGLVFQEERIQEELVVGIREWVGLRGADFLQSVIASASKMRPGIAATLASILTIFFGSTRLFGQLQSSLNRVWGVELKPGRGIKAMVWDRVLSFFMVLGFGFLVLCFLIVTTFLTGISHFLSEALTIPASYLRSLDFVVSFATMTLLFAMIYKVMPDAKVAWRDVWVGAAITSLLFTIGKFLIGLYIGISEIGSAYGTAASLFVLLIWIYYSFQVFLLGAEFTEVYTEQYGSAIQPLRRAMRIKREELLRRVLNKNTEGKPKADE